MLKEILKDSEINQIAAKHILALRHFSTLFNTEKQKQKHKFISPIRKAGFSIKEASFLNFKVSQYLWKNCLVLNKRKLGGRPKLDAFLISKINSHISANSSIAANRYLKRQSTSVMYRNSTIIESHRTFAFRKVVPFSSFYKYIEKKFKKPHRLSDLCDYCEENKVKFSKFIPTVSSCNKYQSES